MTTMKSQMIRVISPLVILTLVFVLLPSHQSHVRGDALGDKCAVAKKQVTISIEDLYKAMRGLENSVRYLGDITAGALVHEGFDRDTHLTVSADASDKLQDMIDGKNHICETFPWCEVKTEDFQRQVEKWTGDASALAEVIAELVRAGREKGIEEIEFVPGIGPGLQYKQEKSGEPDEDDKPGKPGGP